MAIKKASPLFGKINVYDPKDGKQRVEIYIRLDQRVEGMHVGIAIDGSASMMPSFAANIPKVFRTPGANIMEPIGRSLVRFLCERSGDGNARVIYWATGTGGKEIEVLGDVNISAVDDMPVEGPGEKPWGTDTHLLPVLTYFAKEFETAEWIFLLIVTDGAMRDLEEVKDFCMEIAKEIIDGTRKNCKFVIVGAGSEVDTKQIEALDDMFDGTEYEDKIDLWDGKIATEMSDLGEIIDEVDFGVTLPGNLKIKDDKGNEVYAKNDGFPQRLEFQVAEGTKHVTIEVAGQTIEQPLI